jgi:hypothetical protein
MSAVVSDNNGFPSPHSRTCDLATKERRHHGAFVRLIQYIRDSFKSPVEPQSRAPRRAAPRIGRQPRKVRLAIVPNWEFRRPSARRGVTLMSELLKLAADNPATGQILLLALILSALAFSAAIILFIWAFIVERPITMFGFKLPESKLVYETGRTALPGNKKPELWDERHIYDGERSDWVEQRFTKKFKNKPD